SLHRWVERADLKASILLTAVTAALFGIVTAMFQLMPWATSGGAVRSMVEILLFAAAGALLVSGFLAGSVIKPNLGHSDARSSGAMLPGDLVYFGRLRTIEVDDILSELTRGVAEDSLAVHYVEQMRVNSQIAWDKLR